MKRESLVAVVGHLLLARVIVPVVGRPDGSRFAGLSGNPLMLALGLFSVWTSAAFGEEIIFRGYLIGRLAGLLGRGATGWGAAVVLSSVIFGAIHFYQGLAGIVITGTVGLLFGLAYLAVRKNLWVLVIAHGLIDTLSFIQIFKS